MDRQKRAEDWLDTKNITKQQWQGIMAIRKPYKARTYELTDMNGNPTPIKQQAAAIAEYLETGTGNTSTMKNN